MFGESDAIESGESGLESHVGEFNPNEYELKEYNAFVVDELIEKRIPELLRDRETMANRLSCVHVGELYVSFIVIPLDARIYKPTTSDKVYSMAKELGDDKDLEPGCAEEMEARAGGKALRKAKPNFDKAKMFMPDFPFHKSFTYENNAGVWDYTIMSKPKDLKDLEDIRCLFDIDAHVL